MPNRAHPTPRTLKTIDENLVLIDRLPIPTPKRCNIAVPDAKPSANKIGFTAHGISMPCANP